MDFTRRYIKNQKIISFDAPIDFYRHGHELTPCIRHIILFPEMPAPVQWYCRMTSTYPDQSCILRHNNARPKMAHNNFHIRSVPDKIQTDSFQHVATFSARQTACPEPPGFYAEKGFERATAPPQIQPGTTLQTLMAQLCYQMYTHVRPHVCHD